MPVNIGPKIGIQGESEYRKQIQNLTQKTKTYQSELKKVTSTFDEYTTQQEKTEKTGAVISKQYETQADKLKLLKDMLEKAKEATKGENGEIDLFNDKVLKWQQAVNEAEAELNDLGKKMKENTDEIEDFGESLDGTNASTIKFGDLVKANIVSDAIIGGIKALAGAMASVAKAAVQAYKDTVTWADETATLATVTGIGVEQLQEMEYMAGLVDVDVDTITGAQTKLTKSIGQAANGSKTYKKYFKQLGVSLYDTNGDLRDSNEVFYDTIDALGKMKAGTKRDTLAMNIFGKSARDLNPLIEQGGENLAAFAQEAHDAGYVIGEETMQNLLASSDAFDRFNAMMTGVKRNLVSALAPAITTVTETMSQLIKDIDWNEVSTSLGEMAEGFVTWFTNVDWDNVGTKITDIFSNLANAISSVDWAQAFQAITTGAEGIAAVVNGISDVGTWLDGAWNDTVTWVEGANKDIDTWISDLNTDIDTWMTGAWTDVTTWLSGVWTDISTWGSTFLTNVGTWLTTIWTNITTKAGEIVTDVKTSISTAIEDLKNLPQDAIQWGKDLIGNFVEGLKQKWQDLKDGLKGIGKGIKDYLGFSEPKKGPLSDFHTYAPDMIDLFVRGIKDNQYKVTDAISSAFGTPVVNTQTASAVHNYGAMNINVYGAQGQDVNQLADVVMQRMQMAVNRREAIYA